ncbi:MAG: tyrosine--tRNA ligase [Deltaproteobacteria bacterium]|nr:tyrosine--tRNA ligase [Deltaproteobacteria bacterium]
MQDAYGELEARGFLYQVTDEARVRERLARGPVTFYVGFDPTAATLHVGSLVPILAMRLLQRWGHRAVALVGGGTAMVGDPSGKTEARRLLGPDEIEANTRGLEAQLARFLVLDGARGVMRNNAEWLAPLQYIPFLRDIGRHFSVNRMLSAESYRLRLETGLSFLEFNYMLLQAYDFLVLHEREGCTLQVGGQDQWGNIVAGTDLIRRVRQDDAFGLTLPLLTSSSGEKFGKSVSGAVWLDADRTPPFDFYQFWRNTDDRDVARFLKLFTDLPPAECERLGALAPPLLNRAKEILGYEVTRLTHGAAAAAAAWGAACREFGEADPEHGVETSSGIRALSAGGSSASLPEVILEGPEAFVPIPVLDLFVRAGLCTSRGEARRLVRQGGARIGDRAVADETETLVPADAGPGTLLKAGRKRVARLVVRPAPR